MADIVEKVKGFSWIGDFLQTTVNKFGTKWFVTLIGMLILGYLAYQGKLEGWQAGIGIVVIDVGYLFARRAQEKEGKTE